MSGVPGQFSPISRLAQSLTRLVVEDIPLLNGAVLREGGEI
jgi:hypothetical protein